MITAAEYGRRIGVAKSRMSALFGRGLPFTEGRDPHGRICKFIDPAAADAWRAANLTPKADGEGRVRGLVEATASASPGGGPAATTAPLGEAPASGGATNDSALRIQSARAAVQEIELETRQVRLAAQRGALVDRTAALDVVRGFAGAVATALDRMPADCATTLAEELGVDQHKAFQALRRVGDRLRDDVARHSSSSAERVTALR